jgi:GNAT superfamily N-acetyltransferase
MSQVNIQVRVGNIDDIELILSFITQKAEFDGCPDAVEATADKLKKTLFCNPPLASVLFAQVEGIAVGLAVFFQTYSSFLAKPSIWLDDIFAQPQMRGKSVGTALLSYLAKIANERECGRIEWTVSAMNARGIDFYKKHGVQILERTRLCRVNRATITKLASNCTCLANKI